MRRTSIHNLTRRGTEGTAALEAVLYTTFLLIPVLIIARGITATSLGAIDAAAATRYVVMAESVEGARYEDRITSGNRPGGTTTQRYDEASSASVINSHIAHYPKINGSVDSSTAPATGRPAASAPQACPSIFGDPIGLITSMAGCFEFAFDTVVSLAQTVSELEQENGFYPANIIEEHAQHNYREPYVLYRKEWTQNERLILFNREPGHYDDRVGTFHQLAMCEWCTFNLILDLLQPYAVLQPTNTLSQTFPPPPSCINFDMSAEEEAYYRDQLSDIDAMEEDAARCAEEGVALQNRGNAINAEKSRLDTQLPIDLAAASETAESQRQIIRDRPITEDYTTFDRNVDLAAVDLVEFETRTQIQTDYDEAILVQEGLADDVEDERDDMDCP